MYKKLVGILVMMLLIVTTFLPLEIAADENVNEDCGCSSNIGSYIGIIKKIRIKDPNYVAPKQTINGLPDYFNWKDFGGQDWTTPAKDQSEPQQCGSCAVHACMGILESVINLREGSAVIDPDLSEQYVMSCLPGSAVVPGQGCEYGYETTLVFELLIATTPEGNYYNGALLEECFPYQADDSIPCDDKCPDWVDKLVPVLDFDEWYPDGSFEDRQLIKSQIMEKGPVLTGMLVTFNSEGNFWDWIWSHHNPDDYYPYYDVENYNHIVIIVGWKDDPSISKGGYWICKNSWGTEPGYDGFFNIEYGSLNIDSIGIDWVAYDPDDYEWSNELDQPGAPNINGPTSGDINKDIDYVFSATDPNDKNVKFFISWGDGSTEWTDFYSSGESVSISHKWTDEGVYTILALTMNVDNSISSWTTIDVSIPRTRATYNPLLLQLFERFPNAFPILRQLLGHL